MPHVTARTPRPAFDETDRRLAEVIAERDRYREEERRMSKALRQIVAADQLRPSEMARIAREALTPARITETA